MSEKPRLEIYKEPNWRKWQLISISTSQKPRDWVDWFWFIYNLDIFINGVPVLKTHLLLVAAITLGVNLLLG